MAWNTPAYPITGQLITAGFWGAQIPDNQLILKTQISDVGHALLASRNVAATGVILSTDDCIDMDTTLGAVASSLPLAVSVPGKMFWVKWYTGANLARVACQGGDTFDGGRLGTLFDFPNVGDSQCFHSNGFGYLLR